MATKAKAKTEVKKSDLELAKAKAEAELKKVEKELEKAAKTVKDYVSKNPEKAAAISAGVGAAIGAALAFLVKGKKK